MLYIIKLEAFIPHRVPVERPTGARAGKNA